MNTSNNTILITGGTSGIGFELATQLLALSNTVLITGRDQAKLHRIKKELPLLHTIKAMLSCKRISERVCQQSEWRVEESNTPCAYEKN